MLEALPEDNGGDVVLVGHSYSGMVMTGVAEPATNRVTALVFVDALSPHHRESALDQMPENLRGMLEGTAAGAGVGGIGAAGAGRYHAGPCPTASPSRWTGSPSPTSARWWRS